MAANLLSQRQTAIMNARQVIEQNPVYLDTETTGLEKTDEIVEISIVDESGNILLDSLVKPSQSIPASATRIHGITNDMVQKAPAWPILWQQVRPLVIGKRIVAYNSDFDSRLIKQSFDRYRLPMKDYLAFFDLMKLYSIFRGDWDPGRQQYRYYSLEQAGKSANISLPNAHRSTADTLLTRELLHFIAAQSA